MFRCHYTGEHNCDITALPYTHNGLGMNPMNLCQNAVRRVTRTGVVVTPVPLFTIYRHYVSVREDGTRDSMTTVVMRRHVPEFKARRIHAKRSYPGGEWTQQAVLED